MKYAILLSIALFGFSATPQTIQATYTGFTLWVDCQKRAAVKFRYTADKDSGNYKRYSTFSLDQSIPDYCQQSDTSTYRANQSYERGHLVPANHLDYSREALRQSNYMVNVLPQTRTLNRGAWLLTEEITECYRDIVPLTIIGGPLWTGNRKNDYFVTSHGIETPDAFWKAIIGKNGAIAWLIPNSTEATHSRLDRYLVTLSFIETLTGESFDVPKSWKTKKPEKSWPMPLQCDKG